jgi:hypothetical protein
LKKFLLQKIIKGFIAFSAVVTMLFCSCHQQKPNYSKVRKTLEQVLINDQKYRIDDTKRAEQIQLDEDNEKIVTQIIDYLGWLGKDQIGADANAALFLVVQHSNKTCMEKYLPVLRQAVKDKKARKQHLALLIDRVEVFNNRPQIYGSQGSYVNGELVVTNIIDVKNVDRRRAEMGLDSLHVYLADLKEMYK